NYVNGQPAQVIKVDVAQGNLTYIGNISVDLQGLGFASAALDPSASRLYLVSSNAPIEIHRIGLGNFSESGAISLSVLVGKVSGAMLDSTNGYAYFVTDQEEQAALPSIVVKVRLSDFTLSQELVLKLEDAALCWVIDAPSGFMYVGTGGEDGSRVLKI